MRRATALPRRALLGAALAPLLARPALAMRSPSVELLVGSPPGSAADRWARGVAPFLERAWPRRSVGVRNQPDRGGLDALAELAAAPAERRVIGVISTPLLLARGVEAAEPALGTRIAPLAALVEEPVVLATGAGGPADLGALEALAGQATLGTPPPGTAGHLASLRLEARLGLGRVTFPSAAAARQAAIAGHVAAAMLSLPDAIGALREGRLLALGVAASRRSPLAPETPTLREIGLDLLAVGRRGFGISPAAPAGWRDALAAGLEALAADRDFAEHGAGLGQVPRFLAPLPWAELLARSEEELRRRWQDEPWLPRRA